MKRWEHFEHQADIGVRGIGRTVDEAFQQAALSMTAVILDPASVQPVESIEISCEADDLETLLVDWLNAVIYEMAVRRMLFSRFEVRIDQNKLNAKVWGEKMDAQRHHPTVEVKAATYHSLAVRQGTKGEWIAECVVDV